MSRLGVPFEQLLHMVGEGSVRQKPLTVAELAEVAVLAASDRSGALTATTINVTCGAVVD